MAIAVTVIPLFMLRLMIRIEKKRRLLQRMLKQSQHSALHDALTDLPNRKSFNAKLRAWVTRGKPFALLFIDLDGFKEVNDTYGHAVGDQVLREVAIRLRALKEEFTNLFLARLGGDEFVLLYAGEVDKVSELAKRLLDDLRHPYQDGAVQTVSASVGIAHYPEDATEDSVLKRLADQAMYLAKNEGKNRACRLNHTGKEV